MAQPSQRPAIKKVCITRGCIYSFDLLMMGGVSPETCWAIKKYWNNKFYYTVASCWFFLWDLYYDERIHEHHENKILFSVEFPWLLTKSLRGEESFLKSYQSLSYSCNTRQFLAPKSSSHCSQQPITGSYQKLYECNPNSETVAPWYPFLILFSHQHLGLPKLYWIIFHLIRTEL